MTRRLRPAALAIALAASLSLGFRAGCGEPQRPGFITDERGGALILHGLNVISSAKSDPLRVGSWTREDARHYARDWGFNFVRLLIFWDAVEPEPGVYDEVYLDRVAERIAWLHSERIHVVLDMHQDVYSSVYCCDGAPTWAVRAPWEDYEPLDVWSLNYFMPEVMEAWDAFWDADGPDADLQQHYAAAWAHVAKRFRGHPAVLGYDLMNEPGVGSHLDFLATLGLARPRAQRRFDEEQLHPFYERIVAAIRGVDSEGWIFLEPRYAGPANAGLSAVPYLDDPRPGPDRIVWFPHLYSIDFEFTGTYAESNQIFTRWEARHTPQAERLAAPMLVGEFGVSPHWNGFDRFLREFMAMADAATSGWAYWSADRGGWGPANPDGSDSPIAGHLVRVYPRRVAGTPLSYGYDPETRVFHLTYQKEWDAHGPTEIYVPATRYYPGGFDYEHSGGTEKIKWDPKREILMILPSPQPGLREFVLTPRS